MGVKILGIASATSFTTQQSVKQCNVGTLNLGHARLSVESVPWRASFVVMSTQGFGGLSDR